MYRHIKFKYVKLTDSYIYRNGTTTIRIHRYRIYRYKHFEEWIWECCSYNHTYSDNVTCIAEFKHLRQAKLYVRCNVDNILVNQTIKDII